jgi:diaminohydroxyphosphoribosylaminopyrimidine deaminase/5-amino-6-(5-phosphoribosylamino)uracil reductase
MARCIALARRARGRTSPNPMVGAVLCKAGRVVAEGYHGGPGTDHAEALVLRAAGRRARGASLYVNLEPCCVEGRTPPCVPAIVTAGVKRVAAAMLDPNPRVNGRGVKQLRSAGVEVDVGVLEEQARRLNEVFCKWITEGVPFVALKTAMTLDGKIATKAGKSRWISSPEARRLAHKLRGMYDAVMVGANTAVLDDPLLTVRDSARPARRAPTRIVVDSRCRTPLQSKLLSSSDKPPIILTTSLAPKARREGLAKRGAQVIVCGRKREGVDLEDALGKLAELGITSVLVEGGGELIWSFFERRLVDKAIWIISPKVFGGRAAKTPVEGEGVSLPERGFRLAVASVRRIGPDVVVEAYPA